MGGARRAGPVGRAAAGEPAWAEVGAGRGAVAAARPQTPRLSSERAFLLLGYGGPPGCPPAPWLGFGWLQMPEGSRCPLLGGGEGGRGVGGRVGSSGARPRRTGAGVTCEGPSGPGFGFNQSVCTGGGSSRSPQVAAVAETVGVQGVLTADRWSFISEVLNGLSRNMALLLVSFVLAVQVQCLAPVSAPLALNGKELQQATSANANVFPKPLPTETGKRDPSLANYFAFDTDHLPSLLQNRLHSGPVPNGVAATVVPRKFVNWNSEICGLTSASMWKKNNW